MSPSKKRRKLNSFASGPTPKTPKPTPYVESINALSPKDFYYNYCRPVQVVEKSHRIREFHLNSTLLKEEPEDPTAMTLAEPLQEMNVIIKAASQLYPEDLDDCFNFIEQTSRADYEASSMGWSPAKKQKEMRLPDLKYLLLLATKYETENDCDGEYVNKVIGFLSFMPTYEDGHRVFYIYEIHLHPSMQGFGLGTILMKVAESIGRNTDELEKMMLTVFRSNGPAQRFYERLGWSVDENSPEWVQLRGGRRRDCDYQIWSKSLK